MLAVGADRLVPDFLAFAGEGQAFRDPRSPGWGPSQMRMVQSLPGRGEAEAVRAERRRPAGPDVHRRTRTPSAWSSHPGPARSCLRRPEGEARRPSGLKAACPGRAYDASSVRSSSPVAVSPDVHAAGRSSTWRAGSASGLPGLGRMGQCVDRMASFAGFRDGGEQLAPRSRIPEPHAFWPGPCHKPLPVATRTPR